MVNNFMADNDYGDEVDGDCRDLNQLVSEDYDDDLYIDDYYAAAAGTTANGGGAY